MEKFCKTLKEYVEKISHYKVKEIPKLTTPEFESHQQHMGKNFITQIKITIKLEITIIMQVNIEVCT